MKVHLAKFTPWQLRRCRQVQCRSLRCIQYGDTEVELSCVEQLVEISQAEFTEPLRFLRTFDCWGKKECPVYLKLSLVFCHIYLCHPPVAFFCCFGQNMVLKSNGGKNCLRALFPLLELGEKLQKRNGANWR